MQESPKNTKADETEVESLMESTPTSKLESTTKMIKNNSNRTLHERNKGAFLGSVADETSNFDLILSNHACLVLVKKANYMMNSLKKALKEGDKILLDQYALDKWSSWVQTKEYETILKYISEEEEIFAGYLSSIVEKFEDIDKSAVDVVPGFTEVVNMDLDKSKHAKFEEVYHGVLTRYLKTILDETYVPKKSGEELRLLWEHADNLLAALQVEEAFSFEDKNGKQFDFTKMYMEMQMIDTESIKKRVNQKLEKIKF